MLGRKFFVKFIICVFHRQCRVCEYRVWECRDCEYRVWECRGRKDFSWLGTSTSLVFQTVVHPSVDEIQTIAQFFGELAYKRLILKHEALLQMLDNRKLSP